MLRKSILRPGLVLVLVLLVFATGLTAQEMMYSEAPVLAEQVAAGELPPLEERLPDNPLVLQPLEEIGHYGGTLRRGSANLGTYLTHNFTREPLTMWHLPVTGDGPIRPNLAESWESNEDFTVWTVQLRSGVKWSDGTPLTTADVDFYWNNAALDENVTGVSGPGPISQGGNPPALEIVDENTLRFSYESPFPAFAEGLATMREIAWPRHYMEQFHPVYNEEATYEIFNLENRLENGRGRATLQAWMLDEYIPGEIYKMKRNPYYWKVDPEGQQLPYMDAASVELVEDRQAVALGNITGQFDLDAMWVGVQHIQLFTEAIQEGRDVSLTFADFDGVAFYFNLDHSDPVKRAAFRDVNFRRAFSMAINRQEIGDLYYAGLFTPSGSVFAPESGFYDAEVAKLWSAYDPEAAAAMLEAAGYVDVDGDGMRESPSGEALQIIIEVGIHDLYTPIVELVTEYMTDIGLNALMDADDQSLVRERYVAGEFEIHTWDRDGASDPFSAEAPGIASVRPGTPWWHQNGAEDPVDEAYVLMNELYQQALGVIPAERSEVVTEISRLHADNVWVVSTGFWRRPFIKSGRLGNTPDVMSRNGQVNDMPPWQPMLLFEKYAPGEGP